jgi:glycosyltransferase involved in cell wall biosynthesis
MRILMISTEPPDPTRGGGGIRSYHFTQMLATRHEVTSVILSTKEAPIDGSAATWEESIDANIHWLQRDRGWDDEARAARWKRPRWRRLIEPLVEPLRDHGKRLMIAGNGACVEGPESGKTSLWRTLHGRLLQLRARVAWRRNELFPTIALIYLEPLESLLPEIVAQHRAKPFDLIWHEHSYLYPLVQFIKTGLPDVPTVCNGHNNEWILTSRFADGCRTRLAGEWLGFESQILKHWERRMLRESALVFCCSAFDRETLVALDPSCAAKVNVAPNGVDTEQFQCTTTSSAHCLRVLFTGSASYGPNAEAGVILAKEVMPIVRRTFPDCRLRLAGRDATAVWGGLRDGSDWIEIVSDPPDIRPCFSDVTLVAVPLRAGSGTRLKILEAMSMGKAVVSSSIGSEGLEVDNGVHLEITDDPDSMAETIIALLRHPERCKALAAEARKRVEERYRWEAITARAAICLEEALANK